jgi:diguanylate cyclase (GGDEF)-like protein/PAS domain S-box-containing protein
MLRVYACIAGEHDYRLVLVAGVICLLAAFTAFAIYEQARMAQRHRIGWTALAGFVAGTGIWATHFVAMLAYRPNLPVGYDLPLTILSILAAMLISGAGFALALSGRRGAAVGGGLTIGSGLATMHYLGMAALQMPARIEYDGVMVAASLLIGTAFTIAALLDHARRPGPVPWRPTLLFTLATCGLHFTAMTAASVRPDPRLAVPHGAIDPAMLATGVAAMALVILGIASAMVLLDRKLARNALEEAQRLRTFADAAVEGLVVIDGDRIVDANRSFFALAGYDGLADAPASLSDILLAPELDSLSMGPDARPAASRLLRADGEVRDVELLLRPLEWRGKPLRIVALRDVTERREAAERITHLARHDALTGLPNRSVFTGRVADAVAQGADEGRPVALLCIGLDGFKSVNDMHGHAAGDALLVAAAQRLRGMVREHELVARLGGDEFAVIHSGETRPGQAAQLAERVCAALAEPFAIGAETVRISGSVGVAMFPADSRSAPDLIKNADMALSRAKAEARGSIRFYDPSMDEKLRERRLLDADLRSALDQGELSIDYQPLADLGSGRIVGFEALLRWKHPRLGMISPATFIPIAEESALIVRLGAWVLRAACAEAAGWTPALKLSVNLSPAQFTQGDLAGDVEAILADTGLNPVRLELEVTEGLLIKDSDKAIAILERLKALGVQISMDDFGTGYSSLSYFRMFPFDKVKIDQSFIRDMIENPQARGIVRSVIGLSRGLGMPVVAEGVETSAQLKALREEGCDQVQGYLIARPNPIGHFSGVVIDRAGDDVALKALG